MNNTTYNTYYKNVTVALYALFLQAVKTVKLSLMTGSQWTYFGVSQALAPLSGFYGNFSNSILLYILRLFLSILFSGLSITTSFFYHIPTLTGAFYISQNSKFAKILIPTLCLVLFVIHPVGSHAYCYALYWLIPIVLAFINKRSIFLISLGGTFTTHAVGSIIWLYTKNLDAAVWNSLISIVWAERLLFALAMTTAYYTIHFGYKLFNQKAPYYLTGKAT